MIWTWIMRSRQAPKQERLGEGQAKYNVKNYKTRPKFYSRKFQRQLGKGNNNNE